MRLFQVIIIAEKCQDKKTFFYKFSIVRTLNNSFFSNANAFLCTNQYNRITQDVSMSLVNNLLVNILTNCTKRRCQLL